MEGLISNLDIFVFMRQNSFDANAFYQKVLASVIASHSEEEKIALKKFCFTYTSNLKKKWKSLNSSAEIFTKKYAEWLDLEVKWPAFVHSQINQSETNENEIQEMEIESVTEETECSPSTSFASPATASVSTSTAKHTARKKFVDLSPLQKKRRTESLVSENDFETLAYALINKASENESQKDIAEVIKHLICHPEDASVLRACIKPKQRVISADKALGLLTSLKLSKWQYTTLKQATKSMGCNIFPCYDILNQEKKKCYLEPNNMQITDTHVKLKLQSVLDLTVKRIFQTLDSENVNNTLTLTSKWGFDGASGQSNYKQVMESGEDDSSIFMCSFVPLKIENGETNEIIWDNPKPSSTFYCRPIYFKFAKENDLNIKEEMASIELEIASLQPTVVDGIQVNHKLHMTMIDGKITSILSNTSSATCDICQVKPKEMNDIDKVLLRNPTEEIYRFGLSSLHARIRCMECILHIAYRLEFKKWQAKGDEFKEQMATRKKLIQDRFWNQMGLRVDVVKQGAGTTNDGNTARRFFADPAATAQITGIDEDLIRSLGVILQVISCGEFVDVEKFRTYCHATTRKYIELYSWYYMPSSMHKLLIHGADIIEHNNFVPIGKLSEEASEARNKDFKHFRCFRSRKNSRKATNEDIINNLLVSSDPYVSSFRPKIRQLKYQPLSEDAKLLLLLTSSADKENFEFLNVGHCPDCE